MIGLLRSLGMPQFGLALRVQRARRARHVVSSCYGGGTGDGTRLGGTRRGGTRANGVTRVAARVIGSNVARM